MAQIELTRANAWKNFGLLIEACRVLDVDADIFDAIVSCDNEFMLMDIIDMYAEELYKDVDGSGNCILRLDEDEYDEIYDDEWVADACRSGYFGACGDTVTIQSIVDRIYQDHKLSRMMTAAAVRSLATDVMNYFRNENRALSN